MPNAWIEHVKKYAKDNNVKYNVAIREAKASYQKKGNGLKRAGEGLSRPGERPYAKPPKVKHSGKGLVQVGNGLVQTGGEMEGEGIKETYDDVMRVINNNPILKLALAEGKKALGKLNKQTGSGMKPQVSPARVKQAMAEITNTINKVNKKVQSAPETQSGNGQVGGFFPLLASVIPALSSLASTLGPILASAGVGVLVDKIIGKGHPQQGEGFIEDVLQVGSYIVPGVNLAMSGIAKSMKGNGTQRGNISTTIGQKKARPISKKAMEEQLARL